VRAARQSAAAGPKLVDCPVDHLLVGPVATFRDSKVAAALDRTAVNCNLSRWDMPVEEEAIDGRHPIRLFQFEVYPFG
jgi:hypothetical protein